MDFMDFNHYDTTNLLISVANKSTVQLPSWNDTQGTVYYDDGNGHKRGISWSPQGFVLIDNGVILESYPPAFPLPKQTNPVATYYVDSQAGSDRNRGTSLDAPWKSITKVNGASFKPGDTVLFKRGSIWNESLNVPASGTSDNVIKFGAYGSGARPILDGGNARARVVDTEGKRFLWFDNLDIRRGSLSESINSVSLGMFFIPDVSVDIALTNLTIRESQGNGFLIGHHSQNIRVKDTEIRDNAGWGIAQPGYTTTAGEYSGVVIANCDLHHNASLLHLSTGTETFVGVGGDTQIYGNYFHDQMNPDHMLYRNWSEYNSDTAEGKAMIYDNIFAAGGGEISFAPIGMKGRGGRVYRNKIVTAWAHAIEASFGYSLAGDRAHNLVYAHHNIIYDIHKKLWGSGSGLGILAPDGKNPNGTNDLYAWNNTIDDVTNALQLDQSGGDKSKLHTRNNLFTNMVETAMNIKTPVNTIENDYNYYYPARDFVWGRNTIPFSAWQNTYHQDISGRIGGDPQYVDGAGSDLLTRNYALNLTSPARGVGTDQVYLPSDPNSWIGANYVPHATSPDAGAYQSLSSKTLDFSKLFLGVTGHTGKAATFKLWSDVKIKLP